jgi:hypothetical protein
MKVLGDMYLLIGLHGDAIKCYEDGAERSRVVGDVLWEAVAREGRAAAGVGEAWEARDGSVSVLTGDERGQSYTQTHTPAGPVATFLQLSHTRRDPGALSLRSRLPLPCTPSIPTHDPLAFTHGRLGISCHTQRVGDSRCTRRHRRGSPCLPLHGLISAHRPLPAGHLVRRRMGVHRPVISHVAFSPPVVSSAP